MSATRTPSPLDAVVHAAAAHLLALRMTRIVGEPDRADASNLIADLEAIYRIVDPVIRAIGEYAQSELGISQKDVDQHFTDQLRCALEGNATFCISDAFDAIQEQRDEIAADPKGWERARFEGVD